MSERYKEERLKILELLQLGKITTEEADQLLELLMDKDQSSREPKVEKIIKKDPFKMLKILINSSDGDNVNIKIPVEFASLLKHGRFGNVKLHDYDVDINSILEMVNKGVIGELVSIDTEDGDRIKIIIE